MVFDKDLAQTASLVNESRARREDISRDRYARLWVSKATRELWEQFARDVYPYDDIELSLRNRFFLERLNYYTSSGQTSTSSGQVSSSRMSPGQVATFANIGAGFTSYPFLMDRPCRCLEVDQERVIDYKQRRIAEFQRQGKMPREPQVTYLPADFNNQADLRMLTGQLGSMFDGKPSFIIMEGITYYLSVSVLDRLFEVLAETQARGSILALDFWTSTMLQHPVTRRFRKFLADRDIHGKEDYNPLDVGRLALLPGYEVVEITNIQLLERVFSNGRWLADYENILPENYAVLRKVTE